MGSTINCHKLEETSRGEKEGSYPRDLQVLGTTEDNLVAILEWSEYVRKFTLEAIPRRNDPSMTVSSRNDCQ